MHNFRYFPLNGRVHTCNTETRTQNRLWQLHTCCPHLWLHSYLRISPCTIDDDDDNASHGQYKQYNYNNVSLCHFAHSKCMHILNWRIFLSILLMRLQLFIRIELNDLFAKYFLILCVLFCLRFLHTSIWC